MSKIHAVSIRKLGSNRGCPRLWLEGRLPECAGFKPQTRFVAIKDAGSLKVTLKIDPCGNRMVSRKHKSEVYVPVIDINSAEVLAMFVGLDHIRVIVRDGEITIESLETERRMKQRLEQVNQKLATGEPITIGSLSHGGGILSKAIHDGFSSTGLNAKLAFALDIREELLEHASVANPSWNKDTILLAAPLQELAFDQEVMSSLPQVTVLEAGLPCEASSVAGRSKNGTSCAEEHPLVGHLVVAFIALIARVNPAIVVLENVPPYRNTASMHILRNQLRDFGYEVHETMVNSGDWGTIEHRKRMCMVAVTKGMEFNFNELIAPEVGAPTLGDILDPVPLDDPSWSTMDYLFKKAESDAKSGKGFAMQILNEDATKIGTIGKSYAKVRSTEPKIQHPENPKLLRQLTPREHCRAKGVSECLVAGLPVTIAHEILGQGITPAPFKSIAVLIANSIKDMGYGIKSALTIQIDKHEFENECIQAVSRSLEVVHTQPSLF